MNTPKVSIIVPVYNVENYLRPCLDSILAQTFKDFEAVLVDDGSSDKSGNICDEYAAKDPRFVVVHKPNEGVSKARITAFKHSKGDYITFLDSDDYIDKRYVDHLYECIIKYRADVSCCQYYRVDERGECLSTRSNYGYYDKNGLEQMLRTNYWYDRKIKKSGMPVILCTKMINRKYVKNVLEAGIGLWYGEDQIGLLRLMYNIQSMYISKEPLYYYVYHKGQATKRMDKKRWDANVSFWEMTFKEDAKGYLKTQAPYRLFHHLKRYIDRWFDSASSYDQFKEESLYALSSDVIKKHLFEENTTHLTTKEKIYLFLMKHKRLGVYFYSRKAKKLINRYI